MLGETLLAIWKKTLSHGIFLSQLKIAKITLVFKKDDKKEISIYRHISVLSSTSKIIEKTVVNQFSKNLLDNNILSSRQFGFRSGISTENAIHSILRDIYLAFFKE